MKKLTTAAIVVSLFLTASVNSYSQGRIFHMGIKAGLDFTNMNTDLPVRKFLKTYTGFNTGLVFNFNLPLGFEIQPELLYVQSGVRVDNDFLKNFKANFKRGALRIPVNIQWGFNILDMVKPYIVVSPYMGCALFNDGKLLDYDFDAKEYNQFEYGIGAGVGLRVWKLQLAFKWNWELNSLFDTHNIKKEFKDIVKSSKFNGGELSLAVIF